jgi:hypothetical protein
MAPCGREIRTCSARFVGDSWSASGRFINCKRCLQLGRRGKFKMVYHYRQQLNLKWQMSLPGVT